MREAEHINGTWGHTDIVYKKSDERCRYKKIELSNLRFKFDGLELIDRNYAQVGQDLFPLQVLNGKKNGKYLEIGSGRPFYGNNTYLLEKDFGWTGWGIDYWEPYVDRYNNARKQQSVYMDATKIDWNTFLPENGYGKEIDFLSLDIDPPLQSWEALQTIPFEDYKFGVITFEHDYYQPFAKDSPTKMVRENSRHFLRERGYVLVVPDVSTIHAHNNTEGSFEDWWVHPDLVDMERCRPIQDWVDDNWSGHIDALDYMFSFDWGIMRDNDFNFSSMVREFDVGGGIYQKYFRVNEGDVVVDIGASCGPFTYSIIKQKPDKVICLEPHPSLYETMVKNLGKYPNVVTLNEGISATDGDVRFENLYNDDLPEKAHNSFSLWGKHSDGSGISLKGLVDRFNLEKIDFLKIDCEGGEYDFFTEENFDWITKNIKKIAGEWHFINFDRKTKFIQFRELYLKHFDNFKVCHIDYKGNVEDLTEEVWDESFISHNGWINIFIDNRKELILESVNKRLEEIEKRIENLENKE